MIQKNIIKISAQSFWELPLPYAERVELNGWVKTLRVSNAGVAFLSFTDGSSLRPLQIILNKNLEGYENLIKLTTGASISLIATIAATPERQQDREAIAEEILSFNAVEDPATYPLAPKAHSMEYLREMAHLRPRAHLFQAIAKLRSHLFHQIHRYFEKNSFHWIAAPIITSADCEGAGELFQLAPSQLFTSKESGEDRNAFFGKPAYLTVSGQLNAECYACALGKVYTFGPTFRAENSNTSRHLSEFWMLEPEVAFADLSGIINLAEDLIKSLAKSCLDQQQESLEVLETFYKKELRVQLKNLAEQSYVRMSYTEAIQHLERVKERFIQPVEWGIDLATEHERFLAEEYVKAPVFVTDYPKSIKAFYMRVNDDNKTVAATDLLVPGMGEILGGSQREERLFKLDEQIQLHGLETTHLNWYRDLRRYGTIVHAGFGLGFERLICYFGGVENVRDALPFPRAPKLLNF